MSRIIDTQSIAPELLQALEWRGTNRELRQAFPLSVKHGAPLSVSGLLNTLSHLGYEGNAQNVQVQDIDLDRLPCLFIGKGESIPFILTNDNVEEHARKTGTACFFKRTEAEDQEQPLI